MNLIILITKIALLIILIPIVLYIWYLAGIVLYITLATLYAYLIYRPIKFLVRKLRGE